MNIPGNAMAKAGAAARAQDTTAEDEPASLSATSPAEEIDALTGDPNFMTSLARGLAVIRAFSKQGQGLTIAQISHKTGIPRAAVRRCLHTLAHLGYVHLEGREFTLRATILALGYAYLSSTPLTVSAQPLLDRVSGAVQESCSLAILDDDEILYVARSSTTKRIMSVDLSVGSRLPAYCTSMGRVLLAHLPTAQFDAHLGRIKLRAYTERTVTSREKLRQVLEGVRRAGFAMVDQELEAGLRSIAVPVHNTAGRVIAAINVGAQAARVSARDMEPRFLPHLRAAAGELSLLLR
jgi:IclR family pca regulon transcriptional regulator